MRQNQSGWTFWTVSVAVIILLVLVLLFMRLFPPYFDNLKLQEALDSIADDPRVTNMTRRQIIAELDKILYIDFADEIVDLKESLTIEKTSKLMSIVIDYEVVVPLVYNVSALLEFNNTADVPLQ